VFKPFIRAANLVTKYSDKDQVNARYFPNLNQSLSYSFANASTVDSTMANEAITDQSLPPTATVASGRKQDRDGSITPTRVLVTGYTPWAGFDYNISMETLKVFVGQNNGVFSKQPGHRWAVAEFGFGEEEGMILSLILVCISTSISL
jgi:hypothetical protein